MKIGRRSSASREGEEGGGACVYGGVLRDLRLGGMGEVEMG